MRKLLTTVFVSVVGLSTFAASAQADTLGITSRPADSNASACMPAGVIAQSRSDATTPYFVPGPGTITQWQTVTPDAAAGDDVTLLVLKPVGNAFSVVAVDSRTVEDPAPEVSSYALASPIPVSGGETFGLTASSPDAFCFFNGGSTPAGDGLAGLAAPGPPEAGQTLERVGGDSPGGFTLNLAVTFEPTPTAPPAAPPAKQKKKRCKKKKHRRSAESAKKKKCKKKKKR